MSNETEPPSIEEALKRDRKLAADMLFAFINNPDHDLSRETKSYISVLATVIQCGGHAK